MRVRIEFFLGIVLFFCFLVTGLFGASMGFSADDQNYPQGSETGENIWYGQNACANITTGTGNSFFGRAAGFSTTTGSDNSFFGRGAGVTNTGGNENSFFGVYAGSDNITGHSNCFFGWGAGRKTNTGHSNSFFGRNAGLNSTTGNNNSFFGRAAGYWNTIQGNNSFFGQGAGSNNTGGSDNAFFGQAAGWNNVSGSYNTFIGQEAGQSADSPLTGSSNVFVGQRTGWKNTSGHSNTFLGRNAGAYNTEGTSNTFIGRAAGYNNLTGDHNVFLGAYAGFNELGSQRLYIDATDTAYPLIWGDFNENSVIINGGFRAIAISGASDGRWKKNIEPLISSLDKIMALQGVSFEWKMDEYSDMGMTEGRQIGLIAQDVEKDLPELVTEDKDGYKAVSYSKLTAVLVEAVKELKHENQREKDLLQDQIKKQQAEIEELRAMIKELKG